MSTVATVALILIMGKITVAMSYVIEDWSKRNDESLEARKRQGRPYTSSQDL